MNRSCAPGAQQTRDALAEEMTAEQIAHGDLPARLWRDELAR